MSSRYQKYKSRYKAYSKQYYQKNKDKINKKRKADHNYKLTQIQELSGFQMAFFRKNNQDKESKNND